MVKPPSKEIASAGKEISNALAGVFKFRKPGKLWNQLSPSYRKRMESHGLTASNWDTETGARLRTAARGHSKTPEHPERAAKNPERFPDYLKKRKRTIDVQRTLYARVIARKRRMWGETHRFRPVKSEGNVYHYPDVGHASNVGDIPSTEIMQRFLDMSDSDVAALASHVGFLANNEDDSEQQWYFMFYH